MGMSLPIAGGWAILSILLFVVAGRGEGNYLPLLVFEVISAISYWVSVRTHPNRSCWYCKGSGRHNGWIFEYGQRPCSHCDGGRVPRWGTRIIRQRRGAA